MIKLAVFKEAAILTFSICSNVPNPSATEIVTQKATLRDYAAGEKWFVGKGINELFKSLIRKKTL